MRKFQKLSAVAICLLLAIGCCVGTITVFAEDTAPKDEILELFSETNTYACDSRNINTDELNYDMTTRNDKQVSDSPQITVITYSLGIAVAESIIDKRRRITIGSYREFYHRNRIDV